MERGGSQHAYLVIADGLRARIQSGELAPGDRLPTARTLMAIYNAASHTVTSALRVLQDEGLTVSVHGRGTFVRDDLDVTAVGAHRSAAELEEALQGIVEAVRLLAGEVVEIRRELQDLNERLGD